MTDKEVRVPELVGARIEEVIFSYERDAWVFFVSHRGCDDDSAELCVPEDAIFFTYPSASLPKGERAT